MPCFAGGENLSIVCETYKNITLTEVAGFTERLNNRIECGIEVKYNQAYDCRSDEAKRPYHLSLLSLCTFLLKRFFFHKFPPFLYNVSLPADRKNDPPV
jgi:hypothetical protein